MKHSQYLLSIILILNLASCGLLDSGGGNPDIQSYFIDRIYSVNLDGTGRKLITFGSSFTLLSNGKLLFIKDNKLYTCNFDGTDSTVLSPANIKVYFYQVNFGETKILLNQYYSPYLMNIDGSGLVSINFPGSNKSVNGTAISPDGKTVAYSNFSIGLNIMNYDGSNSIQIKDTSNRSNYSNLTFTPDGNALVYIQDIQQGVALDLRLYNIQTKKDTSLFYNNDGNKVIAFTISKWNTLLFSNFNGVNLMNLKDYTYTLIHRGGDPHFSADSSKITFMDYDTGAIDLMNLKQKSSNLIYVNLPKNYILNPTLSLDGKQIIFQADSSWSVTLDKY